ncbi:MBG domain-containing protein, partial [Flavobacterium undicola]|uniref:MBG domain-containing protein n=1 Tax=Flavobacterium undicola TaxID=1932779 RepID=UPI001F44C2A0
GCTATRSYTLTQPTAINTSSGSQTNVSCNGGTNGSASVSPSGGTPGYTYSWSPSGGTAATATGLAAGSYTVTVTDANGCTATRNYTLTQPSAINTSSGSQTNVSCNGGTNGSASVSPSGGTPGYTYSWSPSGGTAATATGLAAGSYTVTVTDANGCTATRNYTLTQPSAINTSTGSQTNVSCNGGTNGSASVSPSGGTPGYTYSWSPSGGTAATATGLAAGSYTVTVTDANGCTATRNYTITQPSAINTSTGSQTNVSCNGGTNGSASVSPSGGTPGYTYSWSPSGGTAATATGLAAGSYTVTVTDANGCTATRNYTLTQPSAINTSSGSQTNVSCNGGTNGSASVSPSGGTPGYTYSWSPSGGTAATATGLAAGSYTVTVTDANGCTATRNYTLTQPSAINTSTGSQTNVSCNGGTNGSASVSPSGGTPGYTYSWSPSGGTAATATGLAAGSYTVTVTDANGCTATRNYTLTQPTAISTATGSQTNVSCNGGTNGSASVSPSGGTPGYTYSWSPSGGTAATATGLAAGSYTVTVTDANGCTATRNYTITQPSAISTASGSQTNVSCNGGTNGSASVSPSGGTPGYTYSWSPSGGTAATATGLAAGSYTVTVTDANGCTATRNYTLTQPSAISTASGSQTNVSCNGGTNGSASVSPSGGTPGYTYSWSPSGGTAATATGLAAGSYTVTVTDANGCTATRNYTITQPSAISTASGSQTNVSCNGGTNGSASVSPSGGTPGYTYSWSPSGGTAATATGLAAGSYTVTITDANGCTATRNFTVTQPSAISTATGSQTNVSCNGGSNGSASVSPSGGTPGYTYSWSPSGGTAATATGLAAGSYTVTITDANGCSATRNYTITQPSALSFTTTTLPGYDYNSSYSQTISVTGGTGGKSYAVTAGSLPSGFTLSSSGTITGTSTQVADSNFTVTVTDVNSCTATYNFVLKLNQIPIIVTATASQTKVYGQSDPVFTYTVTPSLLSGDSFTGALTRVTGENIGNYAINAGTLSAGSKYLMTFVSKDFAITVKPITVTATASQTKVYGTADPVFANTVSPSLVGSDSFTGALTRAAGENIGTYAITQGSLSAGSNYIISYVSKDFAITAKPITVTATASQTKVYGIVDPVFAYTVSPSLVGSDSFTGALTRVSGENIGTYAITQGSLSAGSNYAISYVSKDFAITAKPITVTVTASQTKVYGAVDPVFAYTVSPSLLGSDSFTGALTRVSGENIGTYAITQGSLSAGSNYTISYVSKDFSITAKPITVTATVSQTKVYGAVNPVYTYSVSPSLVGSDTFTGALTRVSGENIGTYAITQGSLSAGSNYTISYVSKDFAVTAKPITVTATASQTKVYGTVDPVFAYTVSPSLVGSDTFTGALTRVSGENIGTYAIGQGSLSAGSNYTISYVSKDFAITAKPITVTATASQTKVYGAVNPVYTYSVSPSLVGSDTFSGVLTRATGENVGSYAITQGSLSAGSNYTISYVSKDFAITAKPINVTATASQTKVYGAVNPVYTYSVSPSLVGSDTFSGVLTRTTGENIGTYAIIQGSLSAGSNYTISYVSKDFTITAKPITVTATASQTKVYGTADPVFAYTVSPSLVGSDTFTGALTRTVGENVGSYAITQGSLSAGLNYTISYVGANFTIAKANQTITWNQILELGCDGVTTAVLTATSSSGLPVSYTSSNANIATISNGVLALQNYGSAIITASQLGNNNYNAVPVVNLVVVNSQPNLIRKQFEDIIFFDNSSNTFTSYNWYKNGVLVPSQTAQYFKENGALNGTYYAKATRLDGMVVTTCPLVLSPTIEEEYLKIVPNPVKTNASYELITNVSSSRLQNAHIEVYSVGGLLMENKTISENRVTLKAPMVEGIYVVKMTLANGKYFTKNLLVKN